MNALDFILEGLEAELALERELGVRLVELDRSLLAPPPARPVAAPAPTSVPVQRPAASAPSGDGFDFVFLHDRPLTASGLEMMGKIAAALGKTLKTAPVVFEGERPKAKAYIVLGGTALKKWFPEANAGLGKWFSAADAQNVLFTYSPAYILRFSTVSPALQKIKKEMWTAIKSVLQKVAQ